MKPNLMNNALPNLIAEDITKQIMTGALKTGEKLVEHIYAEEYGTSRAPVREAIYLLAVEGLVERIPRKGAIVREYTKSEILDLLEIRNVFEKMSMDRITKHAPDPELLEEMEQILNQMKKAEDVYSYTQLNYAFHSCLIKMSKSEIIMEMYSRLGLPLLKIQSISFAQEGNIEKSIMEHNLIIKLLREQNMTELTVVLSNHNKDVVSNFQKKL
ncbi:GntR family transcriptional regulator [Planococcus sp. CPCC 101016]|uniref:GntR family transcriptional regulator n=1 Tax=Planococcus sp. CPCC 101016 TaxID=2599617 RepID=UPI0011B708E1|nr:GntR family transcriptional regulator [Planococcus sp. CPCC 101016]TWT08038.1 GntR family transcriptional regulator [Planococcus sp. CPCC 101016]